MADDIATDQDRIVVDPRILAGKPVVKGTRTSVGLALGRLAHDLDPDALFGAYPRLTGEDVQACLRYAQALVDGEEVYPAPADLPGAARASR